MVRSGLGEFGWVVEFEVAIDFVGADVVETLVVTADGLEDRGGAHEVRLDKRPWVAQAVVVVALGSKMHHDIGASHERIDELAVADIAGDKFYTVEYWRQVVGIAGIGEFVEYDDAVFWVMSECIVDEVGADEARAARDE